MVGSLGVGIFMYKYQYVLGPFHANEYCVLMCKDKMSANAENKSLLQE